MKLDFDVIIADMLIESQYSSFRRELKDFEDFLSSKRIGSDIDGVDVLLVQGALDEFFKRYGVRKSLSDYSYVFEMNDWVREFEGDRAPEVTFEIWHHPRVLMESLPVPGAVTLSWHLRNLNIPRITSRPANTRDLTLDWYRKNMPWIPESSIYVQSEGGDKINHDFKIETIKLLGIEIFFEDNPKHAKAIVDNTDALVVMVPWSWNVNTVNDSRILRPSGSREGNVYSAYNILARHFRVI